MLLTAGDLSRSEPKQEPAGYDTTTQELEQQSSAHLVQAASTGSSPSLLRDPALIVHIERENIHPINIPRPRM